MKLNASFHFCHTQIPEKKHYNGEEQILNLGNSTPALK